VANKKITKEDLTKKFEAIEEGVTQAASKAAPAIPVVASAVGAVVFVVALYIGYRLGRKRSTVVEVTRL
jgi:type VI protein secretion system component VasF